jgi:RTX toxins and related Ca2+-binding proteins
MIIDVKGTKQKQEDPDPARRYLHRDLERKTQTPFTIGMILMSLVLYLKSFLNDSESEQMLQEEHIDQSRGRSVPDSGNIVAEVSELPAHPSSTEQAVEDVSVLTEEFSPAIFNEPVVGPVSFGIDPASLLSTRPLIVAALVANDNDRLNIPAVNSGGLNLSGPRNSDSAPNEVAPDQPTDHDIGGDDHTSGHSDQSGPGQPPNPIPEQGASEEPSDFGQDGNDDEDIPDGGEDEEARTNRAPRSGGPITLWDLSGCAPFLIGLSDLLGNAVDPDGDTLAVRNVVALHGTMTWKDGQWSFQAEPRFEGLVVLRYEVTDGEYSFQQVAYIQVQPNTIEGTVTDDNIVGTDCGEIILGLAGDDNIYARAGDDVIYGGDGDDHIVAGAGDDVVFGGNGDDIIFGGDGNDVLYGEAGDDYLAGDDGDDILFGGDGNDWIFGGAGDDVADGGDGDDLIYGGDGNDTLKDGNGSDIVAGGAGDDLVIAAADAADDQYDGGEGFDTLDYSATSEGIVVDLAEGIATGEEIRTDTFTDFETIVGGTGDDHFVAGKGEFTLAGGGGDDVFEFLPPAEPAVVAETTPAPTANYTILDFDVGDRVRMSKYDIFERVLDKYEDTFEEIYGDDFDDDDIPIRYRHDNVDALNQTIIEADFNDDGIWETVVTIEGTRALFIIEHA